MRQQLGDTEGVYIKRTRSDKTCSYSGETIPEGDHALRVYVKIDGNSYGAWVSLSHVDGLAAALDSFDPDDAEYPESISPTDYIKYNQVRGEKLRCISCWESIPKGTKGYSFHCPDGMVTQTVWAHLECASDVATALDEVWEYADDLLPEAL